MTTKRSRPPKEPAPEQTTATATARSSASILVDTSTKVEDCGLPSLCPTCEQTLRPASYHGHYNLKGGETSIGFDGRGCPGICPACGEMTRREDGGHVGHFPVRTDDRWKCKRPGEDRAVHRPRATTHAVEEPVQGIVEAASRPNLVIPDVTDLGRLEAALAYAEAGLYLAPTHPDNPKHPGSLLREAWPDKTSREVDQVRLWFSSQQVAATIAAHTGRSGLVVFDVDDPGAVHPLIRRAVDELAPPFQRSRPGEPDRGHYVFADPRPPAERRAKAGSLGKAWGEVRGGNTVIVLAPSTPGREWVRTGPVPELPGYLVEAMAGRPGRRVPPSVRRRRGTSARELRKRMVAGLDELLATEPGKGRHDALYKSACRFGLAVEAGLLTEDAAVQVLTETAEKIFEPGRGDEIARTIADGLSEGGAS